MSSRFVSSGSINTEDVSKQRQEELEASEEFIQDKNQQERKSLLIQLKENRMRRYAEYKQKLESSNTSYQMSASDVEYYQKLQKETKAKEEAEKLEIESELKKFKALRENGTPPVATSAKLPIDAPDLIRSLGSVQKRKILRPGVGSGILKKKIKLDHPNGSVKEEDHNEDISIKREDGDVESSSSLVDTEVAEVTTESVPSVKVKVEREDVNISGLKDPSEQKSGVSVLGGYSSSSESDNDSDNDDQ